MVAIVFKFIGGYVVTMVVMCIDNIAWISDSPEYKDFKKMNLFRKAQYIWGYRIKTVLTNPRDMIAGVAGALIAGAFI